MDGLESRFEDVDNDGDREIVVQNQWIRVELRVPQNLGYAFYKRRFTWGGRLQSLVYRPTGTEFFLTRMIDLEDINPFGLPDELFQSFEFHDSDGDKRILKMGVGVFRSEISEHGFEPLPWTWYQEEKQDELVVAFRQDVRDVGPYSYVYEKRYRFRADAAWFAMDVILENRGSSTIATSWDIHSFHKAGVPPNTAWLVAPKQCWSSCGESRVRTTLKEASPIMATPETSEMVSDRIVWDTDGTPWWYALGPGTGTEFYLLRARFEPYWGMFWAGYDAFTPQGINNVEVPPGDRATFGFDVTVGAGARNFVAAGEDSGVTIDVTNSSARVSAHVASAREGKLSVWVADGGGRLLDVCERSDTAAPEQPLTIDLDLPAEGDFCQFAVIYQAPSEMPLHAEEILPLGPSRPTAHLPFDPVGTHVFVAAHHDLEHPDADGRYLWCHGTQCGFEVDWQENRLTAPSDMTKFDVACLVGDAWPLRSIDLLVRWVEEGGGLLLCAPFGDLAAGLGNIMPMVPKTAAETALPSTHVVCGAGMPRYSEAEWRAEESGSGEPRFERQIHWGTEEVAPVVGLQAGTPHLVARNLMLEPDAKVRIGHWQVCQPKSGSIVPLRYTDPAGSPAVALGQAGSGRVAMVASRPAWGAHYHKVVWDGWGQYHRAFFAGLMGWLAGIWEEA